jgi:hypothetical protein
MLPLLTVMSLQKIFCSTTIIVGLFISVDYGLCDEFRCRGNEREHPSEDAGDWSWQSHSVWTFVYILGLALWSLSYTLLERYLVIPEVILPYVYSIDWCRVLYLFLAFPFIIFGLAVMSVKLGR